MENLIREERKVIKEKEKIDNFLITASITLLAGFSTIMSIKESSSNYSSYFAAVSIFCFALTLFFTLWHRLRKAVHDAMFQKRKNEWAESVKKDIGALLDVHGKALKRILETYKKFLTIEPQIKKDLKEIMTDEINKTSEDYRPLILPIAESASLKLEKIFFQIYKTPLKERDSKIKFVIDYLSDSTRYYVFIIGLITFFITLFFNLF